MWLSTKNVQKTRNMRQEKLDKQNAKIRIVQTHIAKEKT
jgi:hypothetical protein